MQWHYIVERNLQIRTGRRPGMSGFSVYTRRPALP